jgi:hypothetical protein
MLQNFGILPRNFSSRFLRSAVGLFLVLIGLLAWHISSVSASAGINETVNYQARLLTSTGAVVPDGSYNIEFKIYQDGDGVIGGGDESLKWAETRISGNKVVVKNGYFSVYLGSVTPFASNIDWGQDTLWLSVNIGGTGSPTYDGEMSPFTRLSSSPYSLNSKALNGLQSSSFVQLAQGIQTDSSTTNPSIFINKTGATANILQLQRGGSDVLLLDNSGYMTFKPGGTDSASALKIQNAAASETLFSVDTTARSASGGNLLKVGNSTGTDTATTILQVDSATADPTTQLAALSGGIFYNSTSGKLKIIENGVVKTVCNTTDAGCGAGGSTTLASAYSAGSAGDQTITLDSTRNSLIFTNPTSSGTASNFVVRVDQSNTTAGVLALDLVQASNAANGVNLTANSIDSETGLAITANALTAGKGLSIDSSSTAFSGNLAEISLTGSNAANTGSLLKLNNTGVNNSNTALYIDHRATGANNLALRIDDQSGDTTPFVVDGDGRVGIGTSTITGTTERLLQVGSPTNRGNAAVYGELVSKGLRGLTALSNIKDIYVYDTTADTDGGRWIDWATTDKSSWYNETLDDSPSVPCDIATMDRCYSQSFPRKAILVVTSNALYIFDGQSNNLWMKFSQNATGYALGADTNNDPSSVTAANGVIYVGANGSAAGGLYTIDFTNDRMYNYDGTDRSGADVGIGSRNSAVTYNSDNNTNFDIATVGTVADWGKVNDVSVAVLTNSTTPIAATTGPNNGTTIVGLATDSGLTAINMTTQKVFQYSDATDNDYNAVVVTKQAKLYGLNEALGQLERWNNVDNENIATRVNGTPDRVFDETTTPALSKTAPTIIANAPDAIDVVDRGSLADGGVLSTAAVAGSSDLIYVGTNQGLTEIHDHTTAASAWSKFYTTTRQTALMPGTVRRMHMMDDASGDITNQSNKTSILIAKGTPTYGVDGVRGKAMSFNGTSQYACSGTGVTCANDATDNMSTGSWTITTWFKHSATLSGTDVLFQRCYNTTPAAAAGCVAASMTSTGTLAVNVDYDAVFTIGATGTTVFHNSVQTFNDNQWHFLAITRAATTGNINTMIDGKPIGQTAGLNTTLDAAQILSIGADCSVGAACATGANFWDGQIDDFELNTNGTTGTDNNLTTAALHRLYNDARPLLSKKVYDGAADTTSYSPTVITDSSASGWIPNEFAGLLVKISSGSGNNQTRRIVSNTTSTITVTPAFTTTPAANDDFKIDPEALFGSTNSVTAVGITAESPIGEARMLCAGTNDGADGGGVTCFNHQAGPNIVADLYHNDSKQVDDNNTDWSGTGYDNIQSLDFSGRNLAIASGSHTWYETQDVKLGQGLDYVASQLFNIRAMILNLGTTTLAGSPGLEVGQTGGADLAERYTSVDDLSAGELVSLDPNNVGGVLRAKSPYQKDILGIVATSPGLILGPDGEKTYPIALVGRVPVKVTTENGDIKAGDRLASSSTPGYALKATNAGRVVGTVLEDLSQDKMSDCPQSADSATKCGTVTVFVNLTDYTGANAEEAVGYAESNGLLWPDSILEPVYSLSDYSANDTSEAARAERDKLAQTDKLLRYLTGRNASGQKNSEIQTDKLSSGEVNAGNIYAGTIYAANLRVDKIKANQIEGLEVFTDKIASLEAKKASEQAINNNALPSLESTTVNGTDLKDVTIEKLQIKSDLSVGGSILADGLTINGEASFHGNTFFYKLVTFSEKVIFKNDLTFEGKVKFNSDAGGYALIRNHEQEVQVKFEKPYENPPLVTVSVKNSIFTQYVYKDLNEEGFKIVLKNPADADTEFVWTAVQVKDPKTSKNPEPLPAQP